MTIGLLTEDQGEGLQSHRPLGALVNRILARDFGTPLPLSLVWKAGATEVIREVPVAPAAAPVRIRKDEREARPGGRAGKRKARLELR